MPVTMPEGGELIVQAQRQGNHVEVTVTDTGMGMEPEALERCFDIYWSNKKQGTGLGLPTVGMNQALARLQKNPLGYFWYIEIEKPR